MKKIFTLLIGCLLLSNLAFSSIGPVTTAAGVTSCPYDMVYVPVTVEGFNMVGGISLSLNYDDTKFQYEGVVLNPAIAGSIYTDNTGQFRLSFSCDPEINLTDGATLFTLQFSYTGPYSGGIFPLTWNESPVEDNEYSDSQGNAYEKSPFSNFFIDGQINIEPDGCGVLTTAASFTTCPSGTILVPVTVDYFLNVAGVSLTLEYDGTAFDYQGVTLNPVIAASIYDGSTPGVFVLSLVDMAGLDLPLGSTLFTLNFSYTGPPSGGDFYFHWSYMQDANEYTDPDGNPYPHEPFNNYFFDGTITVDPEGCGPITTIGDVSTCPSGTILVPVEADIFYNVGGISLTMNYDPTKFAYNNVILNPAIAGSLVNGSVPGEITISYTTDPGLTLPDNTTLFTVDLSFIGPPAGGTYQLSWAESPVEANEYSDPDGTAYTKDPFENFFIGGDITVSDVSECGPITTSPILDLTCPLSTISVPITVKDFYFVAGISLTMNYDGAILHYESTTLNPAITGSVYDGSVPGIYALSFVGASGFNLPNDAVLFTLTFTYAGPPAGGTTALTWVASPDYANEYADGFGNPLNDDPFGTHFIDGSVTITPSGCTPVEFVDCPLSVIDLGCNPPDITEEKAISDAGHVSDGCGIPALSAVAGQIFGTCTKTQDWTVTAIDGCNNTDECIVHYTWKWSEPLEVTCSTDPELPACTPLTDIASAYDNWVAGFGFTGGCDVSTNILTVPDLPADVDCNGCNLNFTYTATGNCDSENCTASFTVDADTPVEVTCPSDPDLAACTSLADVQTAYQLWLDGFKFSGGCNVTDNLASAPSLPADVVCNGADLEFNYVATGDCGSDNCTAFFTVAADDPVKVTCPGDVSIGSCLKLQDEIESDYTDWVAGFSFEGGCNVTDNILSVPALPPTASCTGASITFEYIATGDCGSDNCTSHFVVDPVPPIEVTCPAPVSIQACEDQSSIDSQFYSWLEGFSFTGGCNAGTTSLDNLEPPLRCEGGTVNVTYIVTDDCQQSDQCQSSFEVAPAPPVELTCAQDVEEDACQLQSVINQKFDDWLETTTFSGGCNASISYEIIHRSSSVDACGDFVEVTWTVSSDCEDDVECTATFSVDAAEPLVANCPGDVSLSACTDLADIQDAYDTWAGEFSFDGGCNVTTNIDQLPALPDDVGCNGAELTFTYSATGTCGSDECTSHFNVTADEPVVVSCPQDPNLPECSSTADIELYYQQWVEGFTFDGGCNVTDNIDDVPSLPPDAACNGASLSFSYTATGDCGSDNCNSTFSVARAPGIEVVCPPDPDLPACTSFEDIEDAYIDWADGFSYSGGCDVADNINNIPSLPPDVNCDGVHLVFTYTASDDCNSNSCTSTFTVGADEPIVVTCSPDPNLPSCATASEILDAYQAWVDGFSYMGGCNVTTNIENVPELGLEVICEGASLNFTYMAEGDCGSDYCTATFTVGADTPVQVFCSDDPELPACTPLANVHAAYNAWVEGFHFTGGCNTTSNIDLVPQLPADADMCDGISLVFTYSAEGDCSSDDCEATFTLDAAEPIGLTCPDAAPVTCQPPEPYASLAEFVAAGGSVTENSCVDPDSFEWTGDQQVGNSFIRTYSISDICGNIASCDQTFNIGEINVSTWVYLEGATVASNGSQTFTVPMRTSLNTLKVLPGQCYYNFFTGNVYTPAGQPYSIAPWNYNGTEGAAFDSYGNPSPGTAGYSSDIVDWVLVSLRTEANSSPVCMKAAQLDKYGAVHFVDGGFDCCDLNFGGPYYIVIEHRSHLIVMSPQPVSVINGTLTFDFRNTQSYIDDIGFGGFGQKLIIPPQTYAMYAGNGQQVLDVNSDIDINFDDRTYWEGQNGTTGKYRTGDYNMNGDCNYYDRITWEFNNNRFSTVPRN
jgi:hypothetical protein